jgi:hypothetical protein
LPQQGFQAGRIAKGMAMNIVVEKGPHHMSFSNPVPYLTGKIAKSASLYGEA